MGTCNSQKKSMLNCEQKYKQAENIHQCSAPQTHMSFMENIERIKTMRQNFQPVRRRMNTGLNGLNILEQIEINQDNINVICQAINE